MSTKLKEFFNSPKVHYYTQARYVKSTVRQQDYRMASQEVKILCSKKYVLKDNNFALTVPERITCKECLEILIPKQEKRLAQMKHNFINANVEYLEEQRDE